MSGKFFKILKFVGIGMGIIGGVAVAVSDTPECVEAFRDLNGGNQMLLESKSSEEEES